MADRDCFQKPTDGEILSPVDMASHRAERLKRSRTSEKMQGPDRGHSLAHTIANPQQLFSPKMSPIRAMGKSWGGSGDGPDRLVNRSDLFGTPSYRSPLDLVHTRPSAMVSQHGNTAPQQESEPSSETGTDVPKSLPEQDSLAKVKSDGLLSFSFGSAPCHGSFSAVPTFDPGLSLSMGTSWSFNTAMGESVSGRIPNTIHNPNKAIVTVDAVTTQILVANDMACELFGYGQEQLVSMQLSRLLSGHRSSHLALTETHLDPASGELVSIAGKVVDAVDSTGLRIPISLWMKRLQWKDQPRCVVVMEPVERRVAHVQFDSQGLLVDCDEEFCSLLGYEEPKNLQGCQVLNLLPGITIPTPSTLKTKDVRKQRITGTTKDGNSFPLSVFIEKGDSTGHTNNTDSNDGESSPVYSGTVWVFTNISGMITLQEDGTIYSVNHYFALALFGYPQADLVGKPVTNLIPDFERHVDLIDTSSMPLPPFDESSEDELSMPDMISTEKTDTQKTADLQNDSENQRPKPDGPTVEKAASFITEHSKTDLNPQKEESLFECLEQLQSNDDSNTDKAERTEGDDSVGTTPDSVESIVMSEGVKTDVSVTDTEKSRQSCSIETPSHSTQSKSSKVAVQKADNSSEVQRVDSTSVHEADSSCSTQTADNSAADQVANKLSSIAIDSNTAFQKTDSSCTQTVDSSAADKVADKLSSITIDSNTAMPETDSSCTQAVDSLAADQVADKLSSITIDSNTAVQQADSTKIATIENTSSQKKASNDSKRIDNANSTENSAEGSNLIKEVKDSSAAVQGTNSKPSSPITETTNKAKDITTDRMESNLLTQEAENTVCTDSKQASTSHQRGNSSPSVRTTKSSANQRTESPANQRTESPANQKTESPANQKTKSSANQRTESPANQRTEELNLQSPDGLEDVVALKAVRSSTPNHLEPGNAATHQWISSSLDMQEGSYVGYCRHKSGAKLGILFQMKRVVLDSGKELWCMWVSRDPGDEIPGSQSHSRANFTLGSNLTSSLEASAISLDNKVLPADVEEENAAAGHYDQRYRTHQCIGKGAFGFVKVAERRKDGEQVVVKFIRKAKVLAESWVEDSSMGRIPLEISLLAKLDHPNIVTMLEAFENEEFFQVVMEKHGGGMDLFEFIDRRPHLDEPLASYIFRQLADAADYLHRQGILHRDIKDENIILNENFWIKLIDFGSAAYMEENKMFATFCGTMEYCSPEVLMGNWYRGPELEMWSIGITLYTLIFGENPFYDVEETIRAVLSPPFEVSPELIDLISWLLHPSPTYRCTMDQLVDHDWLHQPCNPQDYCWNHVLPDEEVHPEEGVVPLGSDSESEVEELQEQLQRCLSDKGMNKSI
ncbi:PAS domain-containing serine/threonine-protein kinase-like [Branchiostoma lanceolatum]|uniref:PAS domain-containing serine/threonine-protein kinase-like n=1 Tax=Branchiostoma lanceolatum TaxID=7740 RepID=UPI0034524A85